MTSIEYITPLISEINVEGRLRAFVEKSIDDILEQLQFIIMQVGRLHIDAPQTTPSMYKELVNLISANTQAIVMGLLRMVELLTLRCNLHCATARYDPQFGPRIQSAHMMQACMYNTRKVFGIIRYALVMIKHTTPLETFEDLDAMVRLRFAMDKTNNKLWKAVISIIALKYNSLTGKSFRDLPVAIDLGECYGK
jgi:hypothetical protein